MTRKHAMEILPLIKAYAKGAVIQMQDENNSNWFDQPDPIFNLPIERYRIKPEPREFTVVVGNDGMVRDADLYSFPGARQFAFKVREVLEP